MKNRFKKGFPIALLFISFVSMILNVVLYSQLRKYYTLLYAVELDPLGLSAFKDVEPPQKQDHQQTIVFYGDSRAAQWPAPEMEGFTFLNRAIGNQTTAQVLLRFNEHLTPLKPDVVVLQVGVNDLKTIPLFPGGSQHIVSNCKANIQQIIDRSLQVNSVVVVSTIFPTGEVPLQRRLVWSDEIEAGIVEVNTFIRSLTMEKVVIFDAAALLSDANEKMKIEYSADELHLNQAGYNVLNQELTLLLEAIQKNLQSHAEQTGQ